MQCTSIELYKAMTSFYRLHPSQCLADKLRTFREAHGLKLEPMGYTDFNQAIEAINQREF